MLEESQPAVRYFTLTDLLGRKDDSPEVKRAYSNISKGGWAYEILKMQKPEGHWRSKRSLYRPKYTATNWMALILSDLGITKENEQVARAADLFFKGRRVALLPLLNRDTGLLGSSRGLLSTSKIKADRKN